jgi:hypothetical protein
MVPKGGKIGLIGVGSPSSQDDGSQLQAWGESWDSPGRAVSKFGGFGELEKAGERASSTAPERLELAHADSILG